MSWFRFIGPVAVVVAAAGCSFTGGNAPITEGPSTTTTYTVKPGDTLYAIARRYSLDPMAIARDNNLSNASALAVGQKLRLSLSSSSAAALNRIQAASAAETPVARPVFSSPSSPVAASSEPAKPVMSSRGTYAWPAKGQIIERFGPTNKGIDIGGKEGDLVRAAASGDVLFVGHVRSYGNLIIVKHPGSDVTAYGWNKKILVKQGDKVNAGDPIAQMGTTEKSPRVHFEVRRNGKPIDPTSELKAQ